MWGMDELQGALVTLPEYILKKYKYRQKEEEII